ncbi:translation initiation factor eIF-3b [Blastocladiella britannica]|nr:translation initiation factor eIF-3b [Blastocladiella britannica]
MTNVPLPPTLRIDQIPLSVDLDDVDALDAHIDYADLEAAHRVHAADPFETVLVIDGVPIVDEGKRDKLFSVIRKQFAKEGVKIKDDGFAMPMHDVKGKPTSKGYMFVDFETAADAAKALKDLQHFKFDKSHTFFLNPFADVAKFADAPEVWDEEAACGPAPTYKDVGFLRDWLLDPQARDQFAVHNDETLSLLWCNKDKAPPVAFEKEGWTDSYFTWSPQGSYLTTLHRPGAALWGTKSMDSLRRFPHPGVRMIDFSPNESFLVTFSPEPLAKPSPNNKLRPWGPESEGHHIIVWNVKTGMVLRTFSLTDEETASRHVDWPLFKWSWDEKYLARMATKAKISIYESATMTLLDKKSLTLPGVTEFEWMPYTPDDEEEEETTAADNKTTKAATQGTDKPAQLTIMSVPDRQIIRSKQVFFGLGGKIHFHPQGDYLLFKVDRTNRSGKASYVSLEVFRLRERDFPADSLELTEIITAFGWEPYGKRFAIVTTTDVPTADLDIKAVEPATEKNGKQAAVPGGVKLVKSFARRSVNSVFWSPKGRYVVFAGLRNLQGILEFYDVDAAADAGRDMSVTTTTMVNGKEVTSVKHLEPVVMLANNDHHGATDVAWDPTGRFLLSVVSMWSKGADNGYMLWDVKGTLLTKQARDKLKLVVWRPRPRSLVTAAKLKQIRKNIKSYAREFEVLDATESSALSAADVELRRTLFEEWYSFHSDALMTYEAVDEVVSRIN